MQWLRHGGAWAGVLGALVAVTHTAHADPGSTASLRARPELEPNYLRPALEIALGLGAATAWYVLDDRNVLDWDHPSIEQRFNGDAWRFDNNRFSLNYIWHPLAGAGMYVLARGNQLGVGTSFAYLFVGSTLWEYVVEFNEKVSINDMIVTPLAGFAVGEFFHKLARLASDAPEGERSPAFSWTAGFPVHAHRRWDGLAWRAPRVEIWRDLSVRYGLELTPMAHRAPRATHALGFGGQLVSLPGFRGPRELRTWFGAAEFAAFSLTVEAGSGGFGAVGEAETWVAGYHQQTAQGASASRWTSALAAAYTYQNTRSFGFRDLQGLVQFPRAVTALAFERRGLELETVLRAHPSFGSMNSLAYPAWREQHARARTKTVLERESYFYGLGFGASAEGQLTLGRLELGGRAGVEHLTSLQGLDRTQEVLSADPRLRETEFHFNLSGKLRASARGPTLGVIWERRSRRSRMGTIETRDAGTRYTLELSLPL